MLLKELFESISISKTKQTIQTILNKLIPNFEEFIDNNDINNELLILSHVIDSLNREFKQMDIVFLLGDVHSDEYVATGKTEIPSGDIDIKVDRESIFFGPNSLYSDSELWSKSLYTTISHELLHREQIIKSNGKIQGSNVSDEEYLGNKHEIQAHAKDAIDFISKNYDIQSKKSMLEYLKNNLEDSKTEIEPIRNYWEAFGKTNPKVWKRFLKYLMFYANEYI